MSQFLTTEGLRDGSKKVLLTRIAADLVPLHALAATNPDPENDAPKIINYSTVPATSCVYPIPGDHADPPAFSSLVA